MDAAHIRDIREDSMLEEFAASLTSSRFVAGASFERLVSPTVVPQLQDEDLTIAATLPKDEDPMALDSRALRTPPPCPIQWAVGSPTAALAPPVDSPSSDVSDDTAKRRLDNFIGKVTCKRDSPLIREPPKQPPAKPVLLWRSRRLAAQPLS
jgi:hypothetical protein